MAGTAPAGEAWPGGIPTLKQGGPAPWEVGQGIGFGRKFFLWVPEVCSTERTLFSPRRVPSRPFFAGANHPTQHRLPEQPGSSGVHPLG